MPDLSISTGELSSRIAPLSPYATLRELVEGEPLKVLPSASVREVLLQLSSRGTDAAVVVDGATQVPLGILTLRDVLRRVAMEAGGDRLEAPVASVMTAGLITVPADTTVHQASVLMVRRAVRHLVLTENDGRCFHIVSQSDLYALPGARSGELVKLILAAGDIPALARLSAEVRGFAAGLLAERVGAEAICQRISALNDLISLQVIEIVSAGFELPYVPWCWLVFGSEGRLEQTLATDQDNGLIFAAATAEEAERLRQVFLPFAQAVNQALDDCGFPLCKGNIMAGNPAWCLSLDEWQQAFGRWLNAAEPEAVLNSTIFFDFRALYGEESLSRELSEWLLDRAPQYPIFLRALAATTMDWNSPLNWWQGFRYDDNKEFPHSIDLKLHGSRPFVDAARIYALTHGVAASNTVERLRGASRAMRMPPAETAALVDAFYHLLRLRLEHQINGPAGEPPNRIDPDRLHELDREILRESLKQARSLQQRLVRDYRLE